MSQISEQRREQIIQTARRIVDQFGPGHLTAEAITQEVGVSRPLLYHYFENMGDLLSAVMAVYLAEFEEVLAAWANEHADDADGTDEWAISLTGMLRRVLVDECPLLRGTKPDEYPAPYSLFLTRCSDAMTDAVESDSPAFEPCRAADNVRAAMRFAVHGLAAAFHGCPELDNETVGALFAKLWKQQVDASSVHKENEPAADTTPEAQPAPKKGLFGWIFS